MQSNGPAVRPLQLVSLALIAGFVWAFHPSSPLALAVLVGLGMVPAHYDGLRHADRFDFASFADDQGGVGLAVWLTIAFAGSTLVAASLTTLASVLLAGFGPVSRFTILILCAVFPPVFFGYRLVARLNPAYRGTRSRV